LHLLIRSSRNAWAGNCRNRILQLQETFGSLDDFERILEKLQEYGHERVKPTGVVTYKQNPNDIVHDCQQAAMGKGSVDPSALVGFYPQYLRSDLISAFQEFFYQTEEARTGLNAYDAFAEHRAGAESSIITFNYDIALERALAKAAGWDIGDGYGFQFLPDRPSSKLTVYKLHGSVNWFKHPINDVPPPVIFSRDLGLLGYRGLVDPRVGGNGMGVDTSGAFILPDPKKKFYWEAFWGPLWNAAAQRLRGADEVFIHGYSMPVADECARNLLFDNMSKRVTVNVYCRSTSDRIAEEFRGRGFTAVRSFPSVSFEAWAAEKAVAG